MLIFDITTVNSLINITYLTDSFRVALNDSLFKIIHIMPDPAVSTAAWEALLFVKHAYEYAGGQTNYWVNHFQSMQWISSKVRRS